MRHGGEEVSLGLVGNLGCLAGILQHLSLPRLLHAFPGHIESHTVVGRDAIPAVLGTDKAEGQRQYLKNPMKGDDTSFCRRGPAGEP